MGPKVRRAAGKLYPAAPIWSRAGMDWALLSNLRSLVVEPARLRSCASYLT